MFEEDEEQFLNDDLENDLVDDEDEEEEEDEEDEDDDDDELNEDE